MTVLLGTGIIGTLAAEARPKSSTTSRRTSARSRSPARPRNDVERLMVAPLIGRGRRQRHDGCLAHRPDATVHVDAISTSWSGCRSRQRSPSTTPGCSATARGARGRRGSQPGQELLPRRHEPRDPHADERDHRHERPAARHAAQRRAARLRRHHPVLRRRAADDHQRHPRLLEDRGRQGRPRGRAVQPGRLHRGRAGCDRPGRGGQGPRAGLRAEDDLPPAVIGDLGRLRQILLNLLSNAVKFTEQGEVVCRHGRSREAAGRTTSELDVAVRDTGIGIPPDQMGRLFQSFSQADSSIARATAAPASVSPSANAWPRLWTASSARRAPACRARARRSSSRSRPRRRRRRRR